MTEIVWSARDFYLYHWDILFLYFKIVDNRRKLLYTNINKRYNFYHFKKLFYEWVSLLNAKILKRAFSWPLILWSTFFFFLFTTHWYIRWRISELQLHIESQMEKENLVWWPTMEDISLFSFLFFIFESLRCSHQASLRPLFLIVSCIRSRTQLQRVFVWDFCNFPVKNFSCGLDLRVVSWTQRQLEFLDFLCWEEEAAALFNDDGQIRLNRKIAEEVDA